jgi:hypothetical protein
MSNARMIATAIRDQIGVNTLMCIGAHEITVIPESIDKDPNGHLGGLFFKINPNPKMKLHGIVTVTLAANDTYNVKIVDCKGKLRYEGTDIYCDQLGGPDGVIERVTG